MHKTHAHSEKKEKHVDPLVFLSCFTVEAARPSTSEAAKQRSTAAAVCAAEVRGFASAAR